MNTNRTNGILRGVALPVAWMASMLLALPAKADFVDELPVLPLTPAPLPTATPARGGQVEGGEPEGATSSRPGRTEGETNPSPGNSGGRPAKGTKGSSPSAGGTSPQGAASRGGKTGAPAGGAGTAADGGLFGSDVVQHDTQAPISTQGDVLEGSLNKGKVILNGNVEIRQDDTLMKSDTAEVYSKPGSTAPERAVAKGNVSIFKRPNPRVPEIRAIAEELEYFVNDRRVILKGKPKIWRGKELVQGEVIELALDTGDIRIRSARSVVDPRSQQDFKSRGNSRGRP